MKCVIYNVGRFTERKGQDSEVVHTMDQTWVTVVYFGELLADMWHCSGLLAATFVNRSKQTAIYPHSMCKINLVCQLWYTHSEKI